MGTRGGGVGTMEYSVVEIAVRRQGQGHKLFSLMHKLFSSGH